MPVLSLIAALLLASSLLAHSRYASCPGEGNLFRNGSPMSYILNAHTPIQLIHSQRAYRVAVREGLQLFTALQRRVVPSQMLYFPRRGPLDPQAAEVRALVQDRQRPVRSLDPLESLCEGRECTERMDPESFFAGAHCLTAAESLVAGPLL